MADAVGDDSAMLGRVLADRKVWNRVRRPEEWNARGNEGGRPSSIRRSREVKRPRKETGLEKRWEAKASRFLITFHAYCSPGQRCLVF